jgi:hypothetical protein
MKTLIGIILSLLLLLIVGTLWAGKVHSSKHIREFNLKTASSKVATRVALNTTPLIETGDGHSFNISHNKHIVMDMMGTH